jgi:GGDEF domain-containing protein
MSMLAVGFWGAYFGSVALSFIAALLAFMRSARRVALTGALSALFSAGYALVFLGWLPVGDGETRLRVQAHVAAVTASFLGMALFMLLESFRSREGVARSRVLLASLAVLVIGTGWLLHAREALEVAVLMEAIMVVIGLAVSLRSAARGERAGWLALASLPCICVAAIGLDWYAFRPEDTPWQVHAAAAVASMAYLLCIAVAMWSRYSYLIEVSIVMTHGPNFDAVTRLPAHDRTGLQVGKSFGTEGPCGVIVVSIGNLGVVEPLHGRAAYNHALFVCASRLRKLALPGTELARVPEDAFLLLLRHPRDGQQMADYATQVKRRLERPVLLGTSGDLQQLEASGAAWEAKVGIGLLMAPAEMPPRLAIAQARAMSRSAWGYESGIAWYDTEAAQISELPLPRMAA